MTSKLLKFVAIGTALTLGACSTAPSVRVNNTAGRTTVYEDVRSSGSVQGVGLESQDVVTMTDRMMRDMLANPVLVNRPTPPRVIVDSEYFRNESTSRINKNLITDRLRVELNRAANGRLVFVGRHFADMVEGERALKDSGQVDGGTLRRTAATAGGDFRLGGRIASQDAIDPATGMQSRYQMITFEMIDLEYGTIVWSGIYELRKASQDDIIYR